jgi:hypothetical protein
VVIGSESLRVGVSSDRVLASSSLCYLLERSKASYGAVWIC